MKNTVLSVVFALVLVGVGFVGATLLFKSPGAQSEVNLKQDAVRMIQVDDPIRDEGVRVDRVLLAKDVPQATLYVRFQKPFAANVMLLAYDRTGVEIGRAHRALAGKTDEAAYFTFDYDARVPLKSAESFRLVYASVQTSVPAEKPALAPAETVDAAEVPAAEEKPVEEAPAETAAPVEASAESADAVAQ